MQKKEPCYIITFTSTADAILFEKKATAAQLPGRLIPLPPVISAGCGMAWKIKKGSLNLFFKCMAIKKQEASNLLSTVASLHVPFENLHELML